MGKNGKGQVYKIWEQEYQGKTFRKPDRLKENAGAAEVKLTAAEVRMLEDALDRMEMSEVFGGSRIIEKEGKKPV